MIDDEFFGNDKQQALMRRAKHLWAVVGDDPRMSFYGRSASLAAVGPDNLESMISLARQLTGTALLTCAQDMV